MFPVVPVSRCRSRDSRAGLSSVLEPDEESDRSLCSC